MGNKGLNRFQLTGSHKGPAIMTQKEALLLVSGQLADQIRDLKAVKFVVDQVVKEYDGN